jgi:hypothetical protein
MAIQTLDPFIIDINLVSSTDLQKHLSDYTSLLTAFPDESALNSLYWHTDSHSDPITSKIEFFKQLNSGEIKLKDNNDGIVKDKSSPADIRNKNIRDQLNDNSHLSTSTGGIYGEPVISGDNVDIVNKGYDKEWKPLSPEQTHANANAEWSVTNIVSDKKQEIIIPPLEDQYTTIELSGEFGMKDMSAWFISWWIEKFRTAHEVIKRDLIELLGEDNEYLVDFSESVGQLKNLDMYEDTSTLPVYDDSVEAIPNHSIPSTTSSIALYCASEDSKQLISDLSKETNKVFRGNLMQMIEDPSRDEPITSIMTPLDHNKTSHGLNFVSDYSHNTRMIIFIETVHTAIQEHLKGLWKVLELISNRENIMVQGKPAQISLKVEEYTHAVDLLKNKIKKFSATKGEIIEPKFGRLTRLQQTYTNTQVLGVPGVIEE